MSPVDETLHIRPDTYCFLCRGPFPALRWFSEPFLQPFEEWQLDVICLCDVAEVVGDSPQFYALAGNLGDPSFLGDAMVLRNSFGDSLAFDLCRCERPCQRCDPDRRIFFAHLCCWKVTRQRYGNVPLANLHRLALQTRPVVDGPNLADRDLLPGLDFPILDLQQCTGLGDYLRGVATCLPEEIRQEIPNRLRGTLTFSLLSTLQTGSLLGLISLSSASNITGGSLSPDGSGTVDALYAEPIRIFGAPYLRRVALNKRSEVFTYSIPVRSDPIRGVKYVLGTWGLRAISVLYDDGSSSPWLGNPTQGSTARGYGRDLLKLCTVQDDLKILRVHFSDDNPSERQDRALWYDDVDLDVSYDYRIVDAGLAHPPISHYPGWMFARYLPLVGGGGGTPLTLTVYCDSNGTFGIMAFGDSHRMLGSKRGVPITFQLGHGEQIVSLHLRSSSYRAPVAVLGPLMMIGTSSGRFCFFGPGLIGLDDDYWSTVTGAGSGAVTGIFVDAMSFNRTRLQSIGASVDRIGNSRVLPVRQPRIPMPPELSPMYEHSGTSVVFSSASLAGVRKLHLRTVDRRCVGLCVDHLDESMDFLGQWDPSDISSITTIYDSLSGPLKLISFLISSPQPSKTRVVNVCVNTCCDDRDGHLVRHFTDIEMGRKPLHWWFTEDYDDVQLAEERTQEVDLSTPFFEARSLCAV